MIDYDAVSLRMHNYLACQSALRSTIRACPAGASAESFPKAPVKASPRPNHVIYIVPPLEGKRRLVLLGHARQLRKRLLKSNVHLIDRHD